MDGAILLSASSAPLSQAQEPAPAPAPTAEVKTDADGVLQVIINGKEYTPKQSKIIRMRITEDGKAIAEPVE